LASAADTIGRIIEEPRLIIYYVRKAAKKKREEFETWAYKYGPPYEEVTDSGR
jgi:hypothetical protein